MKSYILNRWEDDKTVQQAIPEAEARALLVKEGTPPIVIACYMGDPGAISDANIQNGRVIPAASGGFITYGELT